MCPPQPWQIPGSTSDTYLKYVLEHLPGTDAKDYSKLLPGNIDRKASPPQI